MKNIFVEGHRGYCAEYPENTLISYEAAIDLGVDGFEFDIWLSKDKVPVLMHDGNANRTCGVQKDLRNMTLDEIKELDACFKSKFGDKYMNQGIQVPTLRELCELVHRKRPDMALGVEIKEYTEECVDISVAMLKEYGLFDKAFFYAFDYPTIKYLKTKYNATTMGYPDFQMKRFDYTEKYKYYDAIGISMTIAHSEAGEIYRNKGLPVHYYCADTEDEIKFVINRPECVLITANDPKPLMKILKEMQN